MRKLFEPLLPLLQLLEMLKERAANFHDKVVEARNLAIDDGTGNIVVRNGTAKEYEWQPQAFSLLCSKLRVPVSYASRCSAWLQAENFNAWLRVNPSREFLLRFDSDQVRAVLSPRYQPISNVELTESLYREAGNVLVRAEIDNMRMLLQAIAPGSGRDVSFGDRIHPAMHIVNSEVGHRVVELRAMLYRVICTNGLIMGSGEAGFRRRHLGDADEILRQFRRKTTMAIEAGTTLPGRLGDTRHIRVPDPDPVFNRIGKRYHFDDQELEAVKGAWAAEPGETLWAVIHACTRAGNNPVLSVDSREKLQRTGGRILELGERGTSWID